MSAISKKRRRDARKNELVFNNKQKTEKEETTMAEKQKPKTKRNAPKRVEFEEVVRGVSVAVTMFEAELPTKDGETETKTFGTFKEATEALKAAKLAAKKWIAAKVVSKMLERLSKFEAGKHYPDTGQAGQAFETMRRTMMVFVDTCQAKKEEDDERAS